MFPKHGPWRVTQNRNIIAVNFGEARAFPQIAALHLESSYFRLTRGGCGWGTSVVLMPSLWAMNRLFQGARVQARWRVDGENLCFSLSGRIAHLDVTAQIALHPPEADSVKAQVQVKVEGDAALDQFLDERPGEAFKPVMLSSMRLNDNLWDACDAFVDEARVALPAHGWIGAGASGTRFGLRGGTSRWKTLAPTTEIVLDRELPIRGWVTPSRDPNDDNIGLWAASSTLLRSWNYTVVASSP